MSRIFLSYRREDSAGWTGRIAELLENHFGDGTVFKDIDTITPGADFENAIRDSIHSAEVVIAVIGPRWLASFPRQGKSISENQTDYVQLELTLALKQAPLLIPVLVGGAEMPRNQAVPSELQGLTRLHAIELSDRRWSFDAGHLLTTLESRLGRPRAVAATAAHPTESAPERRKPVSGKLIGSFVATGSSLMFSTGPDNDIKGLMALLLQVVAWGLAVAAVRDTGKNKTRGRVLAMLMVAFYSVALLVIAYAIVTQLVNR